MCPPEARLLITRENRPCQPTDGSSVDRLISLTPMKCDSKKSNINCMRQTHILIYQGLRSQPMKSKSALYCFGTTFGTALISTFSCWLTQLKQRIMPGVKPIGEAATCVAWTNCLEACTLNKIASFGQGIKLERKCESSDKARGKKQNEWLQFKLED